MFYFYYLLFKIYCYSWWIYLFYFIYLFSYYFNGFSYFIFNPNIGSGRLIYKGFYKELNFELYDYTLILESYFYFIFNDF